MPYKLQLEEIEPRKVEAFPSQEFRHKFFLVDEEGNRGNKAWCSGDFFDWKAQLAPVKPDKEWFEFVQSVEQLIDDAADFRKREIPRLQQKEEALGKKIEDLDLHLSVRKKDLAKKLNRNHRQVSAYFTLRDYEAQFNLLHGLAQLTQAQAQVIDLLTMCIIRRIQSRMKWLLPLFAKVFMDGEGEDAKAKVELYVWHPYTDEKGNIVEDYLHPDAFRDYSMILQQMMEPKKFRELIVKKKAEEEQKKAGVVVANENDVRSMENFQKKFLNDQKNG